MRKTPLAIFIGGLAVAVAVTLLTAPSSNGEQPAAKRASCRRRKEAYAQSRDEVWPHAVPVVVFAPLYGSSPRIIQVPQADAREWRRQAPMTKDEAVGQSIDADAHAAAACSAHPAGAARQLK